MTESSGPSQPPSTRPPAAAKGARKQRTRAAALRVKRRVVVVLGMHRSGTSVVTRGLQALGVELGDNLMKPVPGNNEKGFFEDLDIYRLNERLLSMSKSAWHHLAPLDAQSLAGGAFSRERREAVALLSAKLKDASVFAFKDPRTAVLMPFWRCVFEDLDLDDRYIVVVRHPLEVAASLEKRDGMPLAKGVLLWAKHTIDAIRQTGERPRVFVRFERMFDDAEAELRRVAHALELPTGGANIEALGRFRDEFLAPELRHHLIGRNELGRSGVAPQFAVELYDALLAVTDSEDSAIDPDQWRTWVARYDEIRPILTYADELDLKRIEVAKRVDATEKRATEAEARVAALSTQHNAAASEVAALRAELAEARARAAQKDERGAAELAKSEQHAAEAEARANALSKQHTAATDEVAALRAELAEARTLSAQKEERGAAELAKSEQHAAEAEARANVLSTQHNAATGEIAALRTQLVDVRTLAAEQEERIAAELAKTEKRATEAEARAEALSTRHNAATDEIAALRTQLADVRTLAAEKEERIAAELANTEKRATEAEARADALSTQHNAATDEIAALRAELAKLAQDLNQERAHVQEAAADVTAARAALVDAKAQAAEEARLNAELEARLHDAARRVSEQEIARLGEALEMLNASATAAQEALRADLEAARAQASEDAALNATLEARLREAVERFSQRKVSSMQEAFEALNASAAAAREQAATQTTHANAEIARLQTALAEAETRANAEATRLKSALAGAETRANAETARLQGALAEAESRAKREAERLQGALAEAQARAHAEAEHLQGVLTDAEANIERIEGALAAAHSDLGAAEREIERLRAQSDTREQERRRFRRDMLLARGALTQVKHSVSWRLTAPLRAMGLIVRNPIGGTQAVLARIAGAAWRRIPLPAAKRGRLAHRMFAAAPMVFFWSSAYKAWRNAPRAGAPAVAREETAKAPELPDPPDPTLEGYVPLTAADPPDQVSARAIAFYLPQFHPIQENDEWWGEGFTEWTKVRAATPCFEGHYQPHEPDALGYYDLVKQPEMMALQAALAKQYGISGFCFYFYWFAGKRLLETPLTNLLADRSYDAPFCLCWANENWSRRWDGKSNEILIAQEHSQADDFAFIEHVSRYFDDPRYMRIGGKPLLLVYRPALLPNAKQTAQRWRQWLRQNGYGEVYLAYTQSFESAPPERYGFNAAIEFPPNNMGLSHQPSLAPLQPGSALSIYDWRTLAARSRKYDDPPYKLFRGVATSWDNTPRRPNDGAVLMHATPAGFRAWLANAVRDTIKRFDDPDERLVFINAWNEWAEGAHLEPDKRHGYAWLEAARRALVPGAEAPRVLVVTHDLFRHGAQMLAFDLARRLKTQFGCDVTCISGSDGPMAEDFAGTAPLYVLDPIKRSEAEIDAAIAALAVQGYRHAIVNSAASAWIAPYLTKHDIAHVGLVHELPSVIQSRGLAAPMRALDASARSLVFPAEMVRDAACVAAGLDAWSAPIVRPQGLYKAGCVADLGDKAKAQARVTARLGLDPSARFVLGVGFADARKGADIFIGWAEAAASRWPDLHFLWVGGIAANLRTSLEQRRAKAQTRGAKIHFVDFTEDTADFFAGATLFALSSREDPFPSTALEALAAATPVVMIKGAGGIADLAAHGCVALAEEAPRAFVSAAAPWLDDAVSNRTAGLAGRDLIRARFGATSYTGAIADLLGLHTPNISVVVPNYNYAHLLEQRLNSILEQTLAPREILFLDDASTDDSIAVTERVLARSSINWRIVRNAVNSGGPFTQWRKGAELAEGTLLWIAESDDWADPRFLETTAKAFQRPDVVISMTQSKQADGQGRILAPDYLDYVRDISPEKWTRAFIGGGPAEARESLSIKNTIPNVSAVLFRRHALVEAMACYEREIAAYRVAGDWCVYANLLREGALAFTPAALNNHRRHDASVTISRFGLKELAEIARMQAYMAQEFGVTEEQARQARAYLESLVAQFGLAQGWAPAQIEGAMRGIAAA